MRTASKCSSLIRVQMPGLNKPKKCPGPGRKARFGTFFHEYPSSKDVSQETFTPKPGSMADSAPCILQYATNMSSRDSCAIFRNKGEEYCTTSGATIRSRLEVRFGRSGSEKSPVDRDGALFLDCSSGGWLSLRPLPTMRSPPISIGSRDPSRVGYQFESTSNSQPLLGKLHYHMSYLVR